MPTRNYYISTETLELENKVLESAIQQASKKHNVEVALIKAIIEQESNWEQFARRYDYKPLSQQAWFTNAIKNNGLEGEHWAYSCGYMQPLYIIARLEYGYKGDFWGLFDPAVNIDIGTAHLAKKLRVYRGDKKMAISAYNAGSYNGMNKTTYVDPVWKNYLKYGGTP